MTTPALETRHLMLLATLDEVGSLNAAARKLHVTASALSQQLRELEDRLGGALFHRQWRRLTTTAAGRRLTDAAHVFLRDIARAESEVRELLRGARGTLRVATMCHQSYRWLSSVLGAFGESYPDIEVTVVPEAAEAPSEWLLERKLDVALIADECATSPRVRVAPLFRDELVVLVGREHPWFARTSVPARAFADQHLWCDEGALRRDAPLAKALVADGNVAPRKVTYVPTTGVVPIEMARQNLGITLLPRWAVEPLMGAGDLHWVRVAPRGLWLRWAIATRDEEPQPALAGFIRAMREQHPRAKANARTASR